MTVQIGRVGRILTGPHIGKFTLVEKDETGSGWHIWILEDPPGTLPNRGWDAWSDDEEGLTAWFADPDFQVEWLDSIQT